MMLALIATFTLAAAPLTCPPGATLQRSSSAVYAYEICERPAPDGGEAIREGPMLILRDGRIGARMNYRNGAQDGEQINYGASGRILRIARYSAGKLDGRTEHWNEAGVKTLEEEYADGVRTGWHRAWRDDGSLIVESQWQRGELQRYTTYYPNGQRRAEALTPFPNTTITEWDENGKVTKTVTLVDGLEPGHQGTTDEGELSCPKENFARVDALGVGYTRDRCGGFPRPSADGTRTQTYAWVPRKAKAELEKLGCTFELFRTDEDLTRQGWQVYFATRAESGD